jgi:hypothetical protein
MPFILFILMLTLLNASAKDSTNTVVIAGKTRTLSEVELMIRDRAKATKVIFEFKQAEREVNINTNSGSITMIFSHPGGARVLMGSVDTNGHVVATTVAICGGVQ